MVMIANPQRDPNNVQANIPAQIMIANPGYPIDHIHVKRLKILRYYAMHLKRVQREFIPASRTGSPERSL
jgi:hypothetical protein